MYGVSIQRQSHLSIDRDSDMLIHLESNYPQLPIKASRKVFFQRTINFFCPLKNSPIPSDIIQYLSEIFPQLGSSSSKSSFNLTKLIKYNISNEAETLFSFHELPYCYSDSLFTILLLDYLPMRRLFFEAIAYGSIPILITPSDFIPEKFFPEFDIIDYSKFVIMIKISSIPNLKNILQNLLEDKEKLREMQKAIRKASDMMFFDPDYPQPDDGLSTILLQIQRTYLDKKSHIKSHLPNFVK